jgi:ABC-type transporter Mla subunit MlaD
VLGCLAAQLKPYLRDGPTIPLEAGDQTARIYDLLLSLGAQVTVVNPTKVKLIVERARADGFWSCLGPCEG